MRDRGGRMEGEGQEDDGKGKKDGLREGRGIERGRREEEWKGHTEGRKMNKNQEKVKINL